MESTDPVVSWALIAGLGGSVTWLAMHGWRQGRRLRRWAARRGLPVERGDAGRVAVELARFDRDSCHLRRELRGVREAVPDGEVTLVRCRETLDLLPWRSGSGPPKTRVAVLFPAPPDLETFSILDCNGAPSRAISPGVRFARRAANRWICSRLPGGPPAPLSVTLSDGLGVAYLLSPSGSVTGESLDYLRELGRALAAGRGPRTRALRRAG